MSVYSVTIYRVDGHIDTIAKGDGRASLTVSESGSSNLLRVDGIEAETEAAAVHIARMTRLAVVNRGRAPHTCVTE